MIIAVPADDRYLTAEKTVLVNNYTEHFQSAAMTDHIRHMVNADRHDDTVFPTGRFHWQYDDIHIH